jgi:hypothetical protein
MLISIIYVLIVFFYHYRSILSTNTKVHERVLASEWFVVWVVLSSNNKRRSCNLFNIS